MENGLKQLLLKLLGIILLLTKRNAGVCFY